LFLWTTLNLMNDLISKYPIETSTELRQLVSAELAYSFRIVPVEIHQDEYTFLVDKSNWNSNSLDELELILGKRLRVHKIDSEDLERRLISNYRKQERDGTEGEVKEVNFHQDFLDQIILEAKDILSSDIHFEVFENDARIRYRIDGKLIEKYKLKKENYLELVNKVKIKSNLDITEKRLPQDGRILFEDISIRVSILPTLHGEKMVMRLLGNDKQYLGINKIGMSDNQVFEYCEALKASRGIILISGPTGSGKTTTLYASLKLLNKISSNILTVEDPIEYTLEGINQVQLKENIGLTFSSVLRTFLRQDPDIIMLGEIRDAKTAEMAIRASLTGHLVLSTIHTNSAIGTISRLLDMGIPSFLIAETLKISVAQRLVRKLCDNCKTLKKVDRDKYPNEKLNDIKESYEPVGCEKCYYTGYRGRQAIYEMITNNSDLSYLIKNDPQNLVKTIGEQKNKSLVSEALHLVNTGVASIEEIYTILVD